MKHFWPVGSLPFSVLLGLVLIYAGLVFFGPQQVRPDPTWTRIRQEGVLRIGIDPSFPPFESDDGKGNLSGLDISLANQLANRWNVRVQYAYTGFDGLYDALVANQFDIILSALPYNPQKTQDVLFSHSYFNGGPVLVTRAEEAQPKMLADLNGRPVAVELGTSGDAFARKWQRRLKLDLREFSTAADALSSLRSGQAAAVFVDPISFFDFQRAGGTFKTIGPALADELYVVAVRKDSTTLLREINSVIDSMKRDGSLEELEKKWF